MPSSPDQVMVCLSSRSPNSEALLRYASRLAGRLNRNWYAVYVQTASESPTKIDAETQRVLSNALTLAQQLGATVFTYKGDDVVKTILQFAKEYRVGHIVVGRSGRKLPLWKRLSGKTTLIQRLVEEAKGTTVVVLDTREVGTGAIAQAENSGPGCEPGHQAPRGARPAPSLEGDRRFIWHEPMEKEAAMRQLPGRMLPPDNKRSPKRTAWRALTQREQQGSTFLGEDVALPHARLAGLEHAVVGLGVAKQGVSEPATGRSVRIVFLLLSPVSPPEVHVRYLSLISRLSQQPLLCQDLLAAATPVKPVARSKNTWRVLSLKRLPQMRGKDMMTSKRILIVDDDSNICLTLSLALNDLGYDCTRPQRRGGGCDRATIQLVLPDIWMPGVEAWRCCTA